MRSSCCTCVDADAAVSDEQRLTSVVDAVTSPRRPDPPCSPLNLRHRRVTSSSPSHVIIAHHRDDVIGHVTVKEGRRRLRVYVVSMTVRCTSLMTV